MTTVQALFPKEKFLKAYILQASTLPLDLIMAQAQRFTNEDLATFLKEGQNLPPKDVIEELIFQKYLLIALLADFYTENQKNSNTNSKVEKSPKEDLKRKKANLLN